MVKQAKRDGVLHIETRDGVFCVSYKGYLTEVQAQRIMDRMYGYADEQASKSKPSLALFDISSMTGQSSGARSAIKSVKPHTFDKIAVVGGSVTLRLAAQYLVKAGSIDAITKFTRTKHQAEVWLSKKGTDASSAGKKAKADYFVVPLIFVLVLGLTIGSWYQAVQQVHKNQQIASATELSSVKRSLDQRLGVFVNLLEGFKAFFESNDTVNRAQFNNYFESLDLKEKYPGFSVFIYYKKVPASELSQFVYEARTDLSDPLNAKPAYAVTQSTPHDIYYPILYSAKGSSTRNVEGLDIGIDPSRLALLNKSVQTNSLVASDTIDLNGGKIDGSTGVTRPGFYITLPVYATATNRTPDTVVGFVSATFEHKLILNELSNDGNASAVRIYDTKDNTLVFESDPNSILSSRYSVQTTAYKLGGKEWRIELITPSGYGVTDQESNLPIVIAVAGGSISLLLVLLYLAILRSRKRAIDLAQDITKDLRRERNQAVSLREKDEAILSSIGDAVFAIDTHGVITLFNQVAAELSGYDRVQAIGKQYMEVLPFLDKETREVHDSFITKALGGTVSTMKNHTVLIRTDKTEVPVADSAAPIRNAANKIIGVIVVFRDISKEQELDKAKTEFVSLASHQLRTPLSAIKWYGELLLSGDAGKLTEVQHEYIQEIFEGSQRMSGLVDSFLDVSRLEVGKLITQPEPTNVAEIVQDVARELAMQVEAKQITVDLHVEDISAVTADPKQLRMVVQNLLSNAVKYTDKNGTITTVLKPATDQDRRASELQTAKPLWLFSVTDDGYGIPKSQQPKIFSKLFRADNVRRLDVEGTGLGLYIVKQVVKKINGAVWFKSIESKGTTFTVVGPYDQKRNKK